MVLVTYNPKSPLSCTDANGVLWEPGESKDIDEGVAAILMKNEDFQAAQKPAGRKAAPQTAPPAPNLFQE